MNLFPDQILMLNIDARDKKNPLNNAFETFRVGIDLNDRLVHSCFIPVSAGL